MSEKESAKAPDATYEQGRMDNMGKVQNAIIEIIANAKLPTQDVLMVLRVTQRQVEDIFMSQLVAQRAKAAQKEADGG